MESGSRSGGFLDEDGAPRRKLNGTKTIRASRLPRPFPGLYGRVTDSYSILIETWFPGCAVIHFIRSH